MIDIVYYLESNFENLEKGEFNRIKVLNECNRQFYKKVIFKIHLLFDKALDPNLIKKGRFKFKN